jgi:hypothetical protein
MGLQASQVDSSFRVVAKNTVHLDVVIMLMRLKPIEQRPFA